MMSRVLVQGLASCTAPLLFLACRLGWSIEVSICMTCIQRKQGLRNVSRSQLKGDISCASGVQNPRLLPRRNCMVPLAGACPSPLFHHHLSWSLFTPAFYTCPSAFKVSDALQRIAQSTNQTKRSPSHLHEWLKLPTRTPLPPSFHSLTYSNRDVKPHAHPRRVPPAKKK